MPAGGAGNDVRVTASSADLSSAALPLDVATSTAPALPSSEMLNLTVAVPWFPEPPGLLRASASRTLAAYCWIAPGLAEAGPDGRPFSSSARAVAPLFDGAGCVSRFKRGASASLATSSGGVAVADGERSPAFGVVS